MDQLGQFIMYTVLVLIFLNVVVRVRILSSFLYILVAFTHIPVYPGAGRLFLAVLPDVFKKCG